MSAEQMDREVELILDMKKVRYYKSRAKSKKAKKAYDRLEYILYTWQEAAMYV